MRHWIAPACLALVLAVTGCGSQHHGSGSSATKTVPPTRTRTAETSQTAQTASGRAARALPSGDWSQFNFTAQRAGVGPADTGITAADLSQLRLRTVKLPGTADSSAIELHGIRIDGRTRDVLVLTTTYGHTLAIDATTGRTLWEFTPSDIGSYVGSAQITTATPTADPDREYVYATSPDGRVHKLSLATGREVRTGGWPVTVTLDPTHEKLASPAQPERSKRCSTPCARTVTTSSSRPAVPRATRRFGDVPAP
jgi:glucose dehydrogenase